MDLLRDIISSAVTLGALYAVSAVALSLLWGSIGMLNLSHGALMAVGAYASYLAVERLGLPWQSGIVVGTAGGAAAGVAAHLLLVRWTFGRKNFDVNIIIMTMALSIIVVDLINNLIGPNAARQPFRLDGRLDLGGSGFAYQTILIIAASAAMVLGLRWLISRTALGRAIRAVAQEPTAAVLNGVPVDRIVLSVMALAGAVAGASGVLLTAWTTLYPTVGADPLLKALVVCIVGGLGSIPGCLVAAFLLSFLEIGVQYGFGLKWGLPALLVAVIAILTVRPNGLFGRAAGSRL